MLEITFAEGRLEVLPEGAALAILLVEDAARPALFTAIDDATGGALGRGLQAAEFSAGRNKTCVLHGPGAGLSRVVLVGLGKQADLDTRAIEAAGSAAASALRSSPGRVPVGGCAHRRAGRACGAGGTARRLSLRQIPHPRERRGQAAPGLADDTVRRGRRRAGGACRLAGAGGGGAWRGRDPGPGQRTGQRAQPAGVRRADRGTCVAGPRDRDAGTGRDGAARLRGAAWRGNGQRQGAAHRHHALERRCCGCGPGGLHRQGGDVRLRRHLDQAGRRHGGHEVGHGRCRHRGRADGGPRRQEGAGECDLRGGPGGEHAVG